MPPKLRLIDDDHSDTESSVPAPLNRDLLRFCEAVLVPKLQSHVDSVLFRKPVDPVADGAPDYLAVVRQPMDLGTIRRKIKSQTGYTGEDCIRDIELIFSNCRLYNGEGSYLDTICSRLRLYHQSHLSRIEKWCLDHPENKAEGWLTAIKSVHLRLVSDQCASVAWPFLAPVDPLRDGCPDYYKIISQPMDLQTIGERISSSYYTSIEVFSSDMELMFSNCFAFNRPGDAVYNCGLKLREIFLRNLERSSKANSSHSSFFQKKLHRPKAKALRTTDRAWSQEN